VKIASTTYKLSILWAENRQLY